MLIRIFRAKIIPELKDEFEPLLQSVSLQIFDGVAGFISACIGKPTQCNPNEYLMISKWENEQAIKDFMGPAWSEAHIPDGMEKFVDECWVHHYCEV